MSFAYRFHNAKDSETRCKAIFCAHDSISKGELQVGSFVENKNIESFQWRHWACVTSAVITKMNGLLRTENGELDFRRCEGYFELESDIDREMIKAALDRGYVDDAIWRGPPGGNRPPSEGDQIKNEAEVSGEHTSGQQAGLANPDNETAKLPGEGSVDPEGVVTMLQVAADDQNESVTDVHKEPQIIAEDNEKPNGDAKEDSDQATQKSGMDPTESPRPSSENQEQDVATPVKPNGKRGRPPKPKPANTAGEGKDEKIIAVEPTPKGKRGRPPKPKPAKAEGKDEKIAAAGPTPKRQRGRPPKRTSIIVIEEGATSFEPKPKGKRGRPAKAKPATAQDEATELKPKRQRGRPAKAKPVIIINGDAIPVELKPKGKRGRPAKAKPVIVIEKGNEKEEEAGSIQLKATARPGRKSKAQVEQDAAVAENADDEIETNAIDDDDDIIAPAKAVNESNKEATRVKRKAAEEFVAVNGSEEIQLKRKRGRPAKKAKSNGN